MFSTDPPPCRTVRGVCSWNGFSDRQKASDRCAIARTASRRLHFFWQICLRSIARFLWNPVQLLNEGGIKRQAGPQALLAHSPLEVHGCKNLFVALGGRSRPDLREKRHDGLEKYGPAAEEIGIEGQQKIVFRSLGADIERALDVQSHRRAQERARQDIDEERKTGPFRPSDGQ